MNTMMKKGIYIISILAALAFVVLHIGIVCDATYIEDWTYFTNTPPITVANLNFACISALFGCMLILPENRKKLRIFCMALLSISTLLALFYTINAYAGFLIDTYGVGMIINYTTSVIPVVITVASFLVDSYSFKLDDIGGIVLAVTRAAEMMLSPLMLIIYIIGFDGRDTPQLIASTVMISFAFSLTTLASRFENKIIKITVCCMSWVAMIMPIIYLFKGYWGVSAEFIDTVSIISAVGVLACAVAVALVDFAVKKNVSAAGWSCPRCGKANNDGDFCENCGAKNSEYWFCTSCGTKNHKQFCGKCGQKKEI